MPGIVLSLAIAALDLVFAALGYDDFRVVTKPLVALVLAATAWRSEYRLVALGLVAAAIGDELLLRTGDLSFMLGMLAFLAMHVLYIAGFIRAVGWKTANARTPADLLYLSAPIVMNYVLHPYLGSFAIPLVTYAFALAAMARCALKVSPITAIGGLVFMGSDTLLAFAKFWPNFSVPPHLSMLLVDGSYFVAQALIVAGLLRRKSQVTASGPTL